MRQAASIALVVLGLALPGSAAARPTSVAADARRSSSTPTVYEPIAALALSSDGKALVAVYELGTVRVWSVQSHALVRVEKVGGSADVFPSPDGRTLAVEDLDGVELWDVHANRSLGRLYRTPSAITSPILNSVALSRDGRTLATYRNDTNAVAVWDVRSRRRVGRVIHTPSASESKLAFSPDGRTLAVTNDRIPLSSQIAFWNVRSGRQVVSPIDAGKFGVNEVTFRPDGSTIAATVENQGHAAVKIWDAESRKQIGAPIADAYHNAAVRECCGMTPSAANGSLVRCVGGDDGEVAFGPVKPRVESRPNQP